MGNVCIGSSSDPDAQRERKKDLEIQKLNERDRDATQSVKRLLLLGAGESGKSTVVKQMTEIYGSGFSEVEARNWIRAIHHNIIHSIQTLVEQSRTLPPAIPHIIQHEGLVESDFYIPESLIRAADHVLRARLDQSLTEDLARDIERLWACDGIQRTFAHSAYFYLMDTADFFFSKVRDVARPDFVPSKDDIVRARAPTTGIVEREFTIEENPFVIVDVGGQRTERKKWIHCFEGVTGMIFVAALSGYDQVLFEDPSQNRLSEALALWTELANAKWFKNSGLILFLNKKDLFQDKLDKGIPLSRCPELADYRGGFEFATGVEYIEDLFLTKIEGKREVYTHITCATDTENVRVVINAVKDTILHASLEGSGLL